jgi:hypothetical protein
MQRIVHVSFACDLITHLVVEIPEEPVLLRTVQFRPKTVQFRPRTVQFRPRTEQFLPRTVQFRPRKNLFRLRNNSFGVFLLILWAEVAEKVRQQDIDLNKYR